LTIIMLQRPARDRKWASCTVFNIGMLWKSRKIHIGTCFAVSLPHSESGTVTQLPMLDLSAYFEISRPHFHPTIIRSKMNEAFDNLTTPAPQARHTSR